VSAAGRADRRPRKPRSESASEAGDLEQRSPAPAHAALQFDFERGTRAPGAAAELQRIEPEARLRRRLVAVLERGVAEIEALEAQVLQQARCPGIRRGGAPRAAQAFPVAAAGAVTVQAEPRAVHGHAPQPQFTPEQRQRARPQPGLAPAEQRRTLDTRRIGELALADPQRQPREPLEFEWAVDAQLAASGLAHPGHQLRPEPFGVEQPGQAERGQQQQRKQAAEGDQKALTDAGHGPDCSGRSWRGGCPARMGA
jgi:hypothetical protein